jgi:hypothetical protein
MSTLTLTLTKAQREFIEAEIARTGQGDAVDYVRSLIEKERERSERLAFEESLLEAMRGPATLMTPEDWADIRREGRRILAERKQK